uniref:Uncharacterized protein n=1 Tax=Vespula pensylvanica TaxID=30213 RepID=A0A834UGV1_VESPE|nr:hypothetical protein H0235_001070 [Vespula pensylvanica]
MNKRNLYMRIASRNLALKKFNYEIEHRPRRSMLHIDKIISLEAMFLSRSTGRASFIEQNSQFNIPAGSSKICIQYDTSLSRIGIECGERIIENSKPIGFRKRIREKEKRNGRNPLKIVQWDIITEFMKKIGPSVWSEPEFKSRSSCFPDDCFGSLSYPQALGLTFS